MVHSSTFNTVIVVYNFPSNSLVDFFGIKKNSWNKKGVTFNVYLREQSLQTQLHKKNIASPFQHPLSNKLTNTHSFCLGMLVGVRIFTSFLFFNRKKHPHLKPPYYQTILSNTVTLCLGHHICTMSLIPKYIRMESSSLRIQNTSMIFHKRGCMRTTIFVWATPCHKKNSKKETETRKKMGFFGWWALYV